MGREAFNQKFPNWENEIKHEIGLDAWNSTFEGYEPNSEPDFEKENELLENISIVATDAAHEIIDKLLENNELTLHVNGYDLLKKYKHIITIPDWISQYSSRLNLFQKEFSLMINEFILKNIDDINLSFEDMITYPNIYVIVSFFSRDENIEKYNVPDALLSDKNFVRSIFFLLEKNLERGITFIEKYQNNKNFIDGILKAVNFLYYLRGKITAKKVILNMPFSESQRKIVERWLR